MRKIGEEIRKTTCLLKKRILPYNCVMLNLIESKQEAAK